MVIPDVTSLPSVMPPGGSTLLRFHCLIVFSLVEYVTPGSFFLVTQDRASSNSAAMEGTRQCPGWPPAVSYYHHLLLMLCKYFSYTGYNVEDEGTLTLKIHIISFKFLSRKYGRHCQWLSIIHTPQQQSPMQRLHFSVSPTARCDHGAKFWLGRQQQLSQRLTETRTRWLELQQPYQTM